MNQSLDELRSAIAKREITAIAVDTSIFDTKQLDLECGLLSRLQQFADGSIKVVFPDVIVREIEAHLLADIEAAATAIKQAQRLVKKSWMHLSAAPFLHAADVVLKADTTRRIAKNRLDDYLKKISADVVKAEEHVCLGDVMNRYFDCKPPFGEKESKRYEFPDALALLALESWAHKNDTRVLVASTDGDWKSYCAESPRLVHINDLATALGCFQRETANFACQRLAELFHADDKLGFYSAIREAISNQNWEKIEITPEATSNFNFREDVIEISEFRFRIRIAGERVAIEPVDYGEDYLVVQLTVDADLDVAYHFVFENWDGVDRDYVPMGSGRTKREENIELQVLVTLGGDIPGRMKIEEVELLPQKLHVSLGEIEPDWMSNADSYD